MKHELIREWFDNLQTMLKNDIKHSSTLQHPSDTGDDREEIVKKTLRRFLPESVSVGSGTVIDSNGRKSKSVDIVIYDPRYPVFHMQRKSIFPVESVFSTIEVKSILKKDTIKDALENCSSVLDLRPAFYKEDGDLLIAKLTSEGTDKETAIQIVEKMLIPTTYVLGLEGTADKEKLTDHIADYCSTHGVRTLAGQPLIPHVVCTPHCASLSWDDPFYITPSNLDQSTIPAGMILCSAIDTDMGFSILASHLMWHIETRTSYVEPRGPVRRATTGYIPLESLINEAVNEKPYIMKVWKNPKEVQY